jgi:hypothetical protein
VTGSSDKTARVWDVALTEAIARNALRFKSLQSLGNAKSLNQLNSPIPSLGTIKINELGQKAAQMTCCNLLQVNTV